MLQQTRADVADDYFQRWMRLYPSLENVAKASEDQLIKSWEGLGYYSRVRNIHRASKLIVNSYAGRFPSTRKELESLPGIGPYTAGAILSFAYKQKALAVDGNVMRVISRIYGIHEDISIPKTKKIIEEKVLQLLDYDYPFLVSEALIEFGALICMPKPACIICPIQKYCYANKEHLQKHLPVKSKKISIIKKEKIAFVINVHDHYLVKKEEKGKVMSDLYQFPLFDFDSEIKEEEIEQFVQEHLQINAVFLKKGRKIEYHFTRYKVVLYPVYLKANNKKNLAPYEWFSLSTLQGKPFSSGHRKILKRLAE